MSPSSHESINKYLKWKREEENGEEKKKKRIFPYKIQVFFLFSIDIKDKRLLYAFFILFQEIFVHFYEIKIHCLDYLSSAFIDIDISMAATSFISFITLAYCALILSLCQLNLSSALPRNPYEHHLLPFENRNNLIHENIPNSIPVNSI